MQQLNISGTHGAIGFAIGERFGAQINSFLDAYPFIQTLLTYLAPDDTFIFVH